MKKKTLLSKLLILSFIVISILSSCTILGLGIGDAVGNNKIADTYYFPGNEAVLDTLAKGTWIKVYTGKEEPAFGKFVAKEVDTYEFGDGGMVLVLNEMGRKEHTYIELEKIKYITTKDEKNSATEVGGVIGLAVDLSIIGWLAYQLSKAFPGE